MRIVGGTLAGRLFSGPTGVGTRPTSDRAREAIASAVASRRGFAGAVVLDLFAGTGAFSFEALSRGADRALAVDRSLPCLRAITASAFALGLGRRVTTLPLDLSQRRASERIGRELRSGVDLLFADPPWNEVKDVSGLLGALAPSLAEDALVILVFSAKTAPALPRGLFELGRYRYGDTAAVIYAASAPDVAGSGEEP